MDLNFATGLHNLVNAVLFLLVQIPDMIYLRCLWYGTEGPLMCAPDLEPFFAFLVAGLSSLSMLVDNWLDVIYVLVQGFLGWATPSCNPLSLTAPSWATPRSPPRPSAGGGPAWWA